MCCPDPLKLHLAVTLDIVIGVLQERGEGGRGDDFFTVGEYFVCSAVVAWNGCCNFRKRCTLLRKMCSFCDILQGFYFIYIIVFIYFYAKVFLSYILFQLGHI